MSALVNLNDHIETIVAEALSACNNDAQRALRRLARIALAKHNTTSFGFTREAWPHGAKPGRDSQDKAL